MRFLYILAGLLMISVTATHLIVQSSVDFREPVLTETFLTEPERNHEPTPSTTERFDQIISDTHITWYENGHATAASREASKRVTTRNIVVQAESEDAVRSAIAGTGAQLYPSPVNLPGVHIVKAPDALQSLSLAEKLRENPMIIAANTLLGRPYALKGAPNDPFYDQQWHLDNDGSQNAVAGIDINVEPVWGDFVNTGVQGNGIRIGILDSGVQTAHYDLAANINTALMNAFSGNAPGATPTGQDGHGTYVAGLAAARGNNGAGGTGVAPHAQIVPMRVIFETVSDLEIAEALSYRNDAIHIKQNAWGTPDDGESLYQPGLLSRAALADGAENGRNGLGTIYVWAGGNGDYFDGQNTFKDNSNKDSFAGSIYSIAVAGMDDTGDVVNYGEPGSNLIISAPTSSYAHQSITSTSLTHYDANFGGTSASSAIISGAIALLLEAKPGLGWRDVQEILMRSARKVNSPNTFVKGDAPFSSADWQTNAGGIHFNHWLGAGLVDIHAAINLAQSWTNLGDQLETSVTKNPNVGIPDNNTTGRITNFDTSGTNLRVEHVTVTVDIDHASRGQLELVLTSPSGTVSQLVQSHGDTMDDYQWTFMSAANWSEISNGTWTLSVRDRVAGTTGILNSATLTLYGSAAQTGGSDDGAIIVDGSYSGWNGSEMKYLDPADATGATDGLDIRKVFQRFYQGTFYLALENAFNSDISQSAFIFIDADGDESTGYVSPTIGADYMIRGSMLYQFTGGGNRTQWSWNVVQNIEFAQVEKFAEYALPVSAIGSPNAFNFYIFGTTSVGTSDYVPDSVQASNIGPKFFTQSTDPSFDFCLDGKLNEWTFENPVDPAENANASLDIKRVEVKHDGVNVYIGYENYSAAQYGPDFILFMDTDEDPGTGYAVHNILGADHMVLDNRVFKYTGQNGAWSWTRQQKVGHMVNGNTVELVFPHGHLPSERFNWAFYGNNSSVDVFPDNLIGNQGGARYITTESSFTGVPSTDGDASDWAANATADSLDMSPDNPVDVTTVHTSISAGQVHIGILNDGPWPHTNEIGVFLDVDQNPATGLSVFSIGADYLISDKVLFRITTTNGVVDYEWVGRPNLVVIGDVVEYAIPRQWMGYPNAIDGIFYHDNRESGLGGSAVEIVPDGAANGDVISF